MARLLKNTERILCVRRSSLPARFLPTAGFYPLPWQACLSAIEKACPCWLERSRAESNPRFKQLIPYAVVMSPDKRCATYRRAGTERRLHGLRSAGIGGHVAESDGFDAKSPGEAVLSGLLRELGEEMPGLAGLAPRFLGTINEEKTPVGKVHLGLVFLVIAEEPDRVVAGSELNDFHWLPVNSIRGGTGKRFELWSRLALRLVASRQKSAH